MRRWLIPARRLVGLDNLGLGADAGANHRLALLRETETAGALRAETVVGPGLALHADPALGLSGRYASPRGRLLELEAEMAGAGDWIGLHVQIPVPRFEAQGILGFALRGSAPDLLELRACLRSGRAAGAGAGAGAGNDAEGGPAFTDAFFDKHILLHPTEAVHLDVLSLQAEDAVPERAAWRELVFFLPTGSFRLSLTDLRIFLV